MGNPGNVNAGGGFNYEALLKGLESKDHADVDAALSQLSPEVLKQLDQLENKDEVARKLLGTLENLKHRRIEVPGGAKAKVKEAVDSLKETLGDAGVSFSKREVEELSAGKPIGVPRSGWGAKDTKGAKKVRGLVPPAKIEVSEEKKRNFSVEDLKALLEPYAKATRAVELDLSETNLSREHFEVLQAYEGKLKGLNLDRTLRTDDARAACMDFLRSEAARNLTDLNVQFNHMGDAGAEAIAQSPCLQNLTTLNVAGNQIGDAGARAIAQSPNLQNLTELDVHYNQIGDAEAQAIAGSPYLTSLTILNARENLIGPDGAIAIAKSENLQNLTELYVGYNDIRYAGARAIAESPNLRNLTVLDVRTNGLYGIGDAAAIAIAQSPYLQNLSTLDIIQNDIGDEAKQALREAFPGCDVRI